jgi:hypothetical protein
MVDIISKYSHDRKDFDACGHGLKTSCPIPGHEDSNPSFLIYDNTDKGKGWYFTCPKCGKHGNQMQLMCAMGLADNTTKARELLEKEFGIAPPEKWTLGSFAEYKGLSVDVLKDYEWEETPRGLKVPYLSMDGKIMHAAKLRLHPTDRTKYIWEFKDKDVPYGLQSLATADKSVVYITEGETDAMTLIQAGLPAIGISGCDSWKPEYSAWLAEFDKVVVTQDNDEAGEGMTSDIAKALPDKLYILRQNDATKDINDFHLTQCNWDIATFKERFMAIKVYPATMQQYLTELRKNPEVLADPRSMDGFLSAFRNDITKASFISSAQEITKLGKVPIKRSVEAAIKTAPVHAPKKGELRFMLDADGRILHNMENIEILLEHKGIRVVYNEIAKNIFISKNGDIFREMINSDYTEVHNWFINYNSRYDVGDLYNFIEAIAGKNKINPVADYLIASFEKNKADIETGEDRIKPLFDCLTVKHPEKYDYYYSLFRKWMIQSAQIVFNEYPVVKNKEQKAEHCIVLQGRQGLGKTSFFRNMVPMPVWFKDGATLKPENKDIVIQCASKWIVELGELDNTMKNEQASLKSYLSLNFDELRPPYARKADKFARTTSYCASVNKLAFLKDDSGSRRWWVIPVVGVDYEKVKTLDLSLIWGYVYDLWANKHEEHWPTPAQQRTLEVENKAFEFDDDVAELLGTLILDETAEVKKYNTLLVLATVRHYLKRIDDKAAVTSNGLKVALHNLGYEQQRSSTERYYELPIRAGIVIRTVEGDF